jgi:hypothetical protein
VLIGIIAVQAEAETKLTLDYSYGKPNGFQLLRTAHLDLRFLF